MYLLMYSAEVHTVDRAMYEVSMLMTPNAHITYIHTRHVPLNSLPQLMQPRTGTCISQKTYSATLPRTGVVGNLCTVQCVQSGQNS